MYLAKLNKPRLSLMSKTRNINNLKQRHLFMEPMTEPTIDYVETLLSCSSLYWGGKRFSKKTAWGIINLSEAADDKNVAESFAEGHK